MRRINLLSIAVAVLSVIVPGGCAKNTERTQPNALNVAVLFAPDGRGDRSYNDMAVKGVEDARLSTGLHVVEMQPATVARYESTVREVAQSGTGLVIGIGFL